MVQRSIEFYIGNCLPLDFWKLGCTVILIFIVAFKVLLKSLTNWSFVHVPYCLLWNFYSVLVFWTFIEICLDTCLFLSIVQEQGQEASSIKGCVFKYFSFCGSSVISAAASFPSNPFKIVKAIISLRSKLRSSRLNLAHGPQWRKERVGWVDRVALTRIQY